DWLKDEDTSRASIMAAREFAAQYDKWAFDEPTLLAKGWLDADAHLGWKNGTSLGVSALTFIQEEIDRLFIMMEDDRDRYLAEINMQADGLAAYIISFLDADSERRPFTLELIRCGLAIGISCTCTTRSSPAAPAPRSSALASSRRSVLRAILRSRAGIRSSAISSACSSSRFPRSPRPSERSIRQFLPRTLPSSRLRLGPRRTHGARPTSTTSCRRRRIRSMVR